MRHHLLSYMLDPRRQTTEEGEQHFESKFERHVYQRITARGFHVRTQVCVGDPANHRYRIDLVVEGMQGRLAVECDGDKWHGPDRYEQDMARQRDLERAGWQFARIRGGDFYRDSEQAMQSVWMELDRLGIQPGGIDASAAEPPKRKSMDVAERLETALALAPVGEPPPPESVEVSARPTDPPEESAPTETIGTGAGPGVPDAVGQAVEAAESTSNADNLPLFAHPGPTARGPTGPAPYVAFEGLAGPDPRHSRPAQVAEGLCLIIDKEGPMLAKRAYDLYLRSCGIRRMGGELKRSMNKALQHAIDKGRVVKEDESGKGGLVYAIVRTKDAPAVVLRDRGPREFEEIPPSELQLVARRLAGEGGLDIGSDAHLRAVLEFFDLKRLTVQVGTTLLDILGRQYPYVGEILNGEEAP